MKRISVLILFMTMALAVSAGDIWQFVNLGFSEDSSIFVFGQYGIRQDTSIPYASMYFVDVAENDFLPQGVFSSAETDTVSIGQSGIGALYNLLHRAGGLVADHGVSHTRQGRLVYLYVNGDTPRSRVAFRDFNTGTSYEIYLIQNTRTSDDGMSAAFHLQVTATAQGGQVRAYTVGIPDYYREGVSRYRLKQVVLSPDETSIIMVVEKIIDSAAGPSIEYMVETVKVF